MMATTTVKLWSENPGDVTAEGLTIGGIQITYAELVEIHDRQTALDMGVTPDLLELWENQGGHDYADFVQLVDWLYLYAEETSQSPRPSPHHTWVVRGGKGFWRAREGNRD
jgi:hypothetical protein